MNKEDKDRIHRLINNLVDGGYIATPSTEGIDLVNQAIEAFNEASGRTDQRDRDLHSYYFSVDIVKRFYEQRLGPQGILRLTELQKPCEPCPPCPPVELSVEEDEILGIVNRILKHPYRVTEVEAKEARECVGKFNKLLTRPSGRVRDAVRLLVYFIRREGFRVDDVPEQKEDKHE